MKVLCVKKDGSHHPVFIQLDTTESVYETCLFQDGRYNFSKGVDTERGLSM